MDGNLSNALILSGTGITGIAWELGVLFGFEEGGVDVINANLIASTSAGSIVGAQICSGKKMEYLYHQQLKFIKETMKNEVIIKGQEFRKMMAAVIMSSPDSKTARIRIGEAALAASTMSEGEYLELIAEYLPSQEWDRKRNLIINTVNAENGEWVTFDSNSNIPLLIAVAASSAVPGMFPPITINGKRYIDGGIAGTNADLGKGYDGVLILVAEPSIIHPPMGPTMHRKSFQEELKELEQSGCKVMIITPDEESLRIKGTNPWDVTLASASAEAGYRQGISLSEEVKSFWDF
ncbi:MAG: patatin-like phospholipase family protein [Methanobacteriaceae archaeon]|nr:patatin-like phospholipase family protein [Methanobacteriaceae archaeon]